MHVSLYCIINSEVLSYIHSGNVRNEFIPESRGLTKMLSMSMSTFAVSVKYKIQKCNLCSISNDTASQMMNIL